MHRDEVEVLLTAMARGGYATLEDAEFEKDGRTVAYQRVSLTDEGEELRTSVNLRLLVPDASPEAVDTPAVRKHVGGSAKKKDEVKERASMRIRS